jgi:DNA-binding MarR family transcriptional regulator
MAQLDRAKDGLKMSELSRLLMVTGGNVTGLTDELARDGLVSREASPADRRAWIVRLTPKGKSTFAAMAEEHERWIRELFAGFDSQAVAALHAQLGSLRVHLLEKLNPSEAETT